MQRANPGRARKQIAGALAACVLFAVVGPAGGAGGAASDPRTQQQELRKQKAAAASQVDTLKASNKELQGALDALDNELKASQTELARAQASVDEAERQAADIAQRRSDTRARIDALRARITESAVDRYVNPSQSSGALAIDTGDINEGVAKQALLDAVTGRNRDVTEQYNAALADLADLAKQYDAAVAKAEQGRADVQRRVDQVSAARGQQQKVLKAANGRLNAALESIAELDQKLVAVDAAVKKQEQDELAALAARVARATGGAAKPPANVADMVWVNGPGGSIQIHKSVAGSLQALLNAAGAAGVLLGGTGYRGMDRQIELRRANCGSSDYAIYKMPAFSCRPPTALPGSSNHERGLAIDFTVDGFTIRSGSAAYNWLSANASRFGFYNLAGEPWHWSTDGD